MAYFLKGYSNRTVGAILKLSSNTIDSYVANMKLKLDCQTKTELIVKVCQTNFVSYVDELLQES